MHSIATRFFATGAVFALCGMIWGIQMAATDDHLLSPAHGHLNLIGFVAMSVMGAYYALAPQAAVTKLARIHYWLMVVTVLVFAPGIALAILGVSEVLALIGSMLALGSMALFAFIVVRHGVEKRSA
jgi:cbb3-type cytochrome oxidase subunit 1